MSCGNASLDGSAGAEIAEDAERDLTDFLRTYDGVEVIEREQADVDHLTAVRVLERCQSPTLNRSSA